MLIILPPSESKREAPDHGRTLALSELSFPELNAMRQRILDALVVTSAEPDALERLHVKPTLMGQVARNTLIRELPTVAASDLYVGPLHAALDFASLPAVAKKCASGRLVITSSLWGMLRPEDQIPPYRLLVWAELDGVGRVDHAWRSVLPKVLAAAAGTRGLVVDVRSAPYQSIGRPAGLEDRTVTLRIRPEAGARTIGDVIAKRVRGEVARHLLESGASPDDPGELAAVVDERWPARLEPPTGRTQPWTLVVRPSA